MCIVLVPHLSGSTALLEVGKRKSMRVAGECPLLRVKPLD
jgi:hypothetical protein